MAHEEGLIERIRYYFPDIPPVLLYLSLPVAIVAMVVLSISAFEEIPHNFLGNLDSLSLQIISVGVTTIALYSFIIVRMMEKQQDNRISISRKRKCIYLLLIMFALFIFLGVSFIVEHWMKSVFLHARPSGTDTGLARLWFALFPESEESTDVPSGFVMRQTLLLLITLTVILQKGRDQSRLIFSNNKLLIYSISISILFLLVASSRIFSGRHTLKAVGIGIGVGTYLFWFIYVLVGSLIRLESEYLGDIVVAVLIFGIIFYSYSKDAGKWIPVVFAQLLVTGIVNLIVSNRTSQREKGRILGE